MREVGWGAAIGEPLATGRATEWALKIDKRCPSNNWSFCLGIGRQSRVNSGLEDRYRSVTRDACLNGMGALVHKMGTLAPGLARVDNIAADLLGAQNGFPGYNDFTRNIEVGDQVRIRYDAPAGTLAFAQNDEPFRLAFTGLSQERMLAYAGCYGDATVTLI